VRDNLESDDVALLRQKTDALQAAFHKVSEQMYAAAAQQQAAAGGNGAPGPDGAPTDASADEEEVVDAEVVEGEDKA
jgi:molecular chaperone DnaK